MNPQIDTQSAITPENLESNVVGHARRCAVERIRFVSTEISTKQLSANRSNALKSTGPRTPEGRAVSKMNALRHGLLSKEVLVRGLHARESGRDLRALYQVFRTQYQPVGPVEEMLVEQIVTARWRLRRAWTAESGEIALNVDQGKWQRGRPNLQSQVMQWMASGDPERAMQETAFGNRTLVGWLEKLRAQVEIDGQLTEAALKNFAYGDKKHVMSADLEKLRLRLSQNSNEPDQATVREENMKRVLRVIDLKLGQIQSQEQRCRKREAAEEQARQAAAVLPAPEVLDKILRYETKLERQMYRAMSQLERVQRMRCGEALPPPLTMEVSERV